MNNLKQIGIGLRMYSQDFDTLPLKTGGMQVIALMPTRKPFSPMGWVDTIYPYLKISAMYSCPCAYEPVVTDYWFNGNLSAYSVAKLRRPAATMMAGDGNDGREVIDSTYSKTSLPSGWLSDYDAPCYRHLGGANYVFADGHVKWLRPSANWAAPGTGYTFSTK